MKTQQLLKEKRKFKLKRQEKLKRPFKLKRPVKVKLPVKVKQLLKVKRPVKIKRPVTVKRPNAVLYFIAYTLVYPFLKIYFNLDVERSDFEVPNGPHIILSNHFSMIDFLFVMLSFYPHRLNAVTAQKYFNYSPLHKLLPIMGCIPKNMFDPDIRSIVNMKAVLKRGDAILLFPEGRCSSSHAYAGMHKSTGKLIKKFDIPVSTCYIEGAAVCLPHWRKGMRSGRIRLTYKNLFTADELKFLSIDEINTAIDGRLGGLKDTLPIKKPFQTIGSKRLAEGLHMVLYYCPKCKSEFSMTSHGNTIRCNICGNMAEIGRDTNLTPSPGSIVPEKLSLWFRDQVRHEMKSLSEDMAPIIENVKVQTPSPVPGGGMTDSGFGVMKLDPEGWHFDGNLHGETVSLFFPVEAVPAMSYEHCESYQIYYGGDHYVFIPEDVRKCIKYVILAECMHWKFSSRILLTPGVNSGYTNY